MVEATRSGETVLVLGGAGLVGYQVAKRAAHKLHPRRVVIHSLYRREVREALKRLSRAVSGVEFVGYYGNLFLRGRPVPADEKVTEISPMEQKADPEVRWATFEDTFEDFETAYRESCLARLLLETRPQIVFDCVNTATGISYQDVFTASRLVGRQLRGLGPRGRGEDAVEVSPALLEDMEKLLVSMSVPQLILHVRILHRAFRECGTRVYLKVGTTGTGGLGLNIPYTHGEDRPSPTLMSKNAVAFAHTGLLFLMARTPGAPIVKELKPAAMIGYRDINYQVVKGPQIRMVPGRDGPRFEVVPNEPYILYAARTEPLGDRLDTTPKLDEFEPLRDGQGRPRKLELPVVNTGENGFFTRGEFEAITYVYQMEFMTPEEIAEIAVLEVLGANTGKDVVSAIDSAVLSPTYKAGMIRHVALQELRKLEEEKGVPSIALGQLGPPQLAKYLYEAYLFRQRFRTLDALLGDIPTTGQAARGDSPSAAVMEKAEEISQALYAEIQDSPLRDIVTSLGIPILCPDGRTLIRGPYLKIPGYLRTDPVLELDEARIDEFASKGWVDLRPKHVLWWLRNFQDMRMSVYAPGAKWSSERLTREAYLSEEIEIGEVVAWVFNNRLDPPGYRVK
jgi:hypothetical protein